MEPDQVPPQLLQQLERLQNKYQSMGQDLSSYLDGLLYSNFLQYWDYIHVDTLLSLQNPQTDFPDEMVFICYHQITELYFKMILWELDQITKDESPTKEKISEKVTRLNRYWKQLIQSFDIMLDGMDPKQFLKFRMSLLPASGFQSLQYRLIEFSSAPITQMVHHEMRASFHAESPIPEVFEQLYWKRGATELATGKKTLTLQQFEKKYTLRLLRYAERLKGNTLSDKIQKLSLSHEQDADLIEILKTYDQLVNIDWPMAHLKSAAKYLERKPDVIAATGGTNWQKYLPPSEQQRRFFPYLFSFPYTLL